jgi:hypothetical protein
MELNCNCDFSPNCCHNPIIKNEEISGGDVHIAHQCLGGSLTLHQTLSGEFDWVYRNMIVGGQYFKDLLPTATTQAWFKNLESMVLKSQYPLNIIPTSTCCFT